MKKQLFTLLTILSIGFCAEITGKFSGSMGTLMDSAQDNSWNILKATVGLTIKDNDTKLYWETKANTNAFSYLYADMPLTIIPGSVRVGYHRYGILDAEIHPYSDGTLYEETKQKGWGVSYYQNFMDLDLKITHLGNVFFLDNNNADADAGGQKSCLAFMLRDGKDWGAGAILNTNGSTGKNGLSVYGDLTSKFDALSLTGVYFADLSDDANAATITGPSSATKARNIAGLYAKYKLDSNMSVYANTVIDMAQADLKNLLSGGVMLSLAKNLTGYLHIENKEKLSGRDQKTYVALEIKIK
ncbi:MAG: hypothetical protein A2Y40_08790 [Candidatus Margulisbacteria bacterium GWF2_35_9]|nr:MAG: hypothetical protein A2Y40_08790 [Candidatus Margulisbacteria bacterium GWF2_35_9]